MANTDDVPRLSEAIEGVNWGTGGQAPSAACPTRRSKAVWRRRYWLWPWRPRSTPLPGAGVIETATHCLGCRCDEVNPCQY